MEALKAIVADFIEDLKRGDKKALVIAGGIVLALVVLAVLAK